MSDTTPSASLDLVRQELAEQPDCILEAVAAKHRLPLQTVIECLPSGMWQRASGAHFVDAMQDISGWGDVTVVCHTKDVILEFEGPLPQGALGHGFYNLKGGGGLSGHLRHENCRTILFLRRPFMKLDTLSVQFFNGDGEAMFKVFVGRDENRRLKADQIERFTQLETRLGAASQGD